MGAAMEDGMAVDVVLWFILAAMAAWICCGCILTLPDRKQVKSYDGSADRKLDRAA